MKDRKRTGIVKKKEFRSKRTSTDYKPTGVTYKTEAIRLNKYIANSGICSRREADKFIEAGLVKVNGKVVTELGTKVSEKDQVKYNDSLIKNERKVYILLNKPKDYITSVSDERSRKTVLSLISGACRERVYPVGRLDRNTTGLLLLTNDGDLTKRLTHPKYEKKKIYNVVLNKTLKTGDMEKIMNGMMLEDGFVKPDAVQYVSHEDKREIGVEIHSGRNRIIRRIFEHIGYEVVKLDRVYFAGLTKKNLPRGKWRFLNEKEINMLNMNAFK